MSFQDDPTDDLVSLDDLLDLENNDDASVDVDDSGETGAGGSTSLLDSDDDVEATLEDVIGSDVTPGKPFSLADEVERTELSRRGINQEDLASDDN